MPHIPQNPPSGGIITIDEGDRFKIAQAVYNAVTGKTEKLSRAYGKDYLISLEDLQQLNHKCEQACSQWEVLQRNCNITLHQLDDNKEVFSSFERFKLYDTSKMSPCESIVYEFNILLRLPETEKPQPYKITVRVLSKIAMINRMEKEMGPPPFLRLFSSGHVVVEVEYVDYVVARNMLSMIDSWISQVEQEPHYAWATFTQKFSHWFPPAAQFSIVLLFGVSLYHITPAALAEGNSLALLAQWLILSGTALFLAGVTARFLGRLAETGIDRIIPISAIQLNKGDERLLKRFKKRNVLRIIQAIAALILVVAQGVATTAVSDWLKVYLNK